MRPIFVALGQRTQCSGDAESFLRFTESIQHGPEVLSRERTEVEGVVKIVARVTAHDRIVVQKKRDDLIG